MNARTLATITLAAASSAHALAESHTYPARPVRVIVPFAAGGTFDTVARVTSQKLTEMWGQQVIVDNRPGGGTLIATEAAAKANADGYTLYLSPNALAANPALRRKMPVDAQKALTPVVLIASQPMALGAHPSFAATSVKDLVQMAKAKPGSITYGAAGVGSGGHLAGEIFKSMAGIDIVHVSYKGGNLAMADVMANHIPLVMTGLPNLLPHMKAGRVKILGITESARSPAAPDIPTIGETIRGYEFRNWFGILVPKGTPQAILTRLNLDFNKALEASDVNQRLVEQGFVVIGGTPSAFASVIVKDTQKFAEVISRAGITLQ